MIDEYDKKHLVEHCLAAGKIEMASRVLIEIEPLLDANERIRQHGLVADAMWEALGLPDTQRAATPPTGESDGDADDV